MNQFIQFMTSSASNFMLSVFGILFCIVLVMAIIGTLTNPNSGDEN